MHEGRRSCTATEERCDTLGMSESQFPIDALISKLEAETKIWVRVAASKTRGDWEVRILEITTQEKPPRWRTCRWLYPNAAFVAVTRTGSVVANWLRSRRIRLGQIRVPLDGLADTVFNERHQSGWVGLYEPLMWPSLEWRLPYQNEHHVQPPRDLVAEDAPSFMTFETGAASLLGIDWSSSRNLTGSEIVVRQQDTVGKLRHIRIRASNIEIRVEGTHLRGAVVELAGRQPGPTQRLNRNVARTIRFPLPQGIPEESWIVLRKGNKWIDRRFLTWPYATSERSDVEHVVEASTKLEVLIARGEGPNVEFKSSLPENDDDSKRKVMKTVGAFANTDGGSIVFGVSDEGRVTGLKASDLSPKARDRLTQLIESWVSPSVHFRFEVLNDPKGMHPGVLVLLVERGEMTPYGVGTRSKVITYYVRRGATSMPIAPNEVRELARSRPPISGTPSYASIAKWGNF